MRADPQKPPSETDSAEQNDCPAPVLGLSRGDQFFVGIMLAVLAVLSIAYWAQLSGWGRVPVEIARVQQREYDFRLDINHASWVEWAQLEGIGEVLARRIVQDRNENGPFDSIENVQRVNGIGAKKLAAIREWLYVSPSD